MAQWTYSNWITKTDDSDRLTTLRLHIQEVSEYIVRVQGGEGMETELNREYMPMLLAKEQQLNDLVRSTTTFRYGGRNRARFSNV